MGTQEPNFLMSFWKLSPVALPPAYENKAYLQLELLGPNLLHGFQGAQFCGAVAGVTKPVSLCLLLHVEKWKPWDLLTQVHWFPWHFSVRVTGHILGRRMELQVLVCAWSLELHGDFRGEESGVLSCGSFFPFFLWLIASLYVDLERVLLLACYGTLWVPFGVL
jgi:hypothetical protein